MRPLDGVPLTFLNLADLAIWQPVLETFCTRSVHLQPRPLDAEIGMWAGIWTAHPLSAMCLDAPSGVTQEQSAVPERTSA